MWNRCWDFCLHNSFLILVKNTSSGGTQEICAEDLHVEDSADPEGSADPESFGEAIGIEWKRPLIVAGVLCLSCLFWGAIMRPLEVNDDKKDKTESPSIKRKISALFAQPAPVGLQSLNFCQKSSKEITPFCKNDLFYGGSVNHIVKSNQMSSSSWDQYRHLLIQAPKSDVVHETDNAKGFLWSVMHKMVNVKLMFDPKFFLVGLNTFFGILGLYIPYVYLPSLAQGNLPELSVDSAGFLISIIGISNIVGKLVTGWLSDRSWMDTMLLSNLYVLLCGLALFVMPNCTSYGAFIAISLLFGFCAAFVILKTIVLVELLGLDKLTSAFGLLGLYEGMACLITTPIAGALFDATGTNVYAFYMGGGFFILSGLFGFTAMLLRDKKKDIEDDNEKQI